MPDSDWPTAQRFTARTARGIGYASSVTAAVVVIIGTPFRPVLELGTLSTTTLAWTVLFAGLAALIGVIRHLWHLEWIALAFLWTAFLGFLVFVWVMTWREPSINGIAWSCVLTNSTALTVARWVDLWVFSLSATRARRRRR